MWWRKLSEWVQWSATGAIQTFNCSIAQHTTCLEAARVVYGIPKCTFNRALSLLRKLGPGALELTGSMSQWDKDARHAEVSLHQLLALQCPALPQEPSHPPPPPSTAA